MGVSAQGVAILICAQLSCASTSSWVHSLPAETPSLLKGLWRQTFTSLIFLPISLYASHNRKSKPDKLKAIEETSALEKIVYIVMAVVGFGLQNIGMVIGLGMASTASVMCLTNTTPMWLILWSIIMCHPPSGGMVLGAALALVGAIVCASGGSDAGGSVGSNEALGCICATLGGIGGALYMAACRKIGPIGLHPTTLTLMVNLGAFVVSVLAGLIILPSLTWSTDPTTGVFGWAADSSTFAYSLLLSIFPDCFGNFGIMIALTYFEPLIVSMVMLTEPLNATLIGLLLGVEESPPTLVTVVGVAIVLFGCAIVLHESNKVEPPHPHLDARTKLKRAMHKAALASMLIKSPHATASVSWVAHHRWVVSTAKVKASVRMKLVARLAHIDLHEHSPQPDSSHDPDDGAGTYGAIDTTKPDAVNA